MPCLSQRTLRRLLTLATLTLLFATLALAQEASQPGNRDFARKGTGNWSDAAVIGSSKKKLFVINKSDPTHRRTCRVQSLTGNQLVCTGRFGVAYTYQSQDIAALIIPARYRYQFRRHFDAGDKIALGAGILGSISVIALVGPCAGAGALGAVLVLSVIEAVPTAPDQLLYLAPGQTLQLKVRS